MIETTATEFVRQLHTFLAQVEHGETVVIRKHGRTVAKLVPDAGFMNGKDFAKIFVGYKPDSVDEAAAAEISKTLKSLDAEFENEMARR